VDSRSRDRAKRLILEGMSEDESYQPIIHSQADLEDAWRNLMEPLGFSRRTLWLMFVAGDDRLLPQVTEIVDIPPVLDDEDLLGLQRLMEEIGSAGLRPAFLISRPGPGGPTADDRACAGRVVEACRAARGRRRGGARRERHRPAARPDG
jgi:hypothetical protein